MPMAAVCTCKSDQAAAPNPWIYRYHPMGRGERHMGLGPAHTISLDEARELARQYRRMRLDGIDPMEARTERRINERLAAAKNVTLAHCAQGWLARNESEWAKGTANQARQHIRDYILPKIGNLPVSKIDVDHVHQVIGPLQETMLPTAMAVRSRLEGILDWAKAKGYRSGDNPAQWDGPISHLVPNGKANYVAEPHKALPFAEMGQFMATLRGYRHKHSGERPIVSYQLDFVIMTAVRKQQAEKARWSDIDRETRIWTCPWQDTKTGKSHQEVAIIVPLNESAMAILREMEAQQTAQGTTSEPSLRPSPN